MCGFGWAWCCGWERFSFPTAAAASEEASNRGEPVSAASGMLLMENTCDNDLARRPLVLLLVYEFFPVAASGAMARLGSGDDEWCGVAPDGR